MVVSVINMATHQDASDCPVANDSNRDPDEDTQGDFGSMTMDAQRMCENIALSNARIKSQQRNEENLSTNERMKILAELYLQTPSVFLERYHVFLCEDDLQCFGHVSDVYEVSFYLREARKRLKAGSASILVKNRRYEALKRLESEGTYFSDDEMRAREPLLYDQLIGQYLTDEELAETRKNFDPTDLKFSTILMTFMADQETKALYKKQQDRENEAEEEEEDEEEEEEDNERDGLKKGDSHRHEQPKDVDLEQNDDEEEMMEEDGAFSSVVRKPTPATEAEKLLLREEFQSFMRERFLSGEDQDFDYGAVDNNAEYDSLAIRGWDEEEKYFDDEDPCDVGGEGEGSNQSERTGSKAVTLRTDDNDGLDDYEKWTPEEAPMDL